MEALTRFGIRLLEAMFVIGGCGSALVILMAGVEDLITLFRPGSEDTEEI